MIITGETDQERWIKIGRALEPHLSTIEGALADLACDRERGQSIRNQADSVHDLVLVLQHKRPMGAT